MQRSAAGRHLLPTECKGRKATKPVLREGSAVDTIDPFLSRPIFPTSDTEMGAIPCSLTALAFW